MPNEHMFKDNEKSRIIAQVQNMVCEHLMDQCSHASAVERLLGYKLIHDIKIGVHVITYGATEVRVPTYLIQKYGWRAITEFVLHYGDTAGTATLGELNDRFGVMQLNEIDWYAKQEGDEKC